MKKIIAFILLLCLAAGSFFYLSNQPEGSPSYSFDRTFRGFSEYRNMTIYQSTVKGTSMGPTFSPGDNVYWVEAPIGGVIEGDVVVFNSSVDVKHQTTAHRVIDVFHENSKVFLRTQGDNDPKPDEPIDNEWYRGLVIGLNK